MTNGTSQIGQKVMNQIVDIIILTIEVVLITSIIVPILLTNDNSLVKIIANITI